MVRRTAHAARGGAPRDRGDPAKRRIVGLLRPERGEHMAEMRGCDLVVEYLIREKVPYLFGYAGHGAVGPARRRLRPPGRDQDHLPADRVRRRLHGRRVLPRLGSGDPGLHLDRPRPDAAHRRDGERVLRLVRVHRDHGPGGDEPVRLGRAPGGVPPLPGRLPEHREGDHQAELPGAVASTTSASSCRRRSSWRATGRPGPVHIDVPYDLWIRTADVEVPEPEERSQHARTGARPARPRRSARALEMLLKARRPLDPRRRRRDLLGRDRAARGSSPST